MDAWPMIEQCRRAQQGLALDVEEVVVAKDGRLAIALATPGCLPALKLLEVRGVRVRICPAGSEGPPRGSTRL